MCRLRYLRLNRERREKLVHDIQESDRDENSGADARNEVRHSERRKRLHEPKPDKNVDEEDAEDIEAADRDDIPPRPAKAHEECECEEEHRERTRIHGVNERGDDEERQKPWALQR